MLAKEALINAQAAYTEALSLLGDAYALVVPNVEWQFMKRQAAQHLEESKRITQEALELMTQHSTILDEASEQINNAGDFHARGAQQQQMADELLVDADAAHVKSQEAISLGDKTLQEAQKTLETLQGFDSLVQESKGKARDALGQAGQITTLIEQAGQRTREAQNALAGAESDARVARDSAKQAQEHAEQHAEQASKVILS